MKIILSILVVLCYLTACDFKGAEKPDPLIVSLPSFNILLLDSTTRFNTRQIEEGRPILLLYFSPECPYCKELIEAIIKNKASIKKARLYLVSTFPLGEIRKFYERYHLNKYPDITVGMDYESFFYYQLKATSVPYLVIYNRHKKLEKVFIGGTGIEMITKAVNS